MDQLIQLFFKHKWSIFAKGQFGFASRPSWIWIALGVAALGLLVYFLYVRPGYRIDSKSKFGLVALRASFLALLLIMLMRPVVVVPSILPKSASVAVIGPLADSGWDQIGTWGGMGNGKDSVTALQAIRDAVSKTTKVNYAVGLENCMSTNTAGFDEAVKAAKDSSVAVLFVGEGARESGEASSRARTARTAGRLRKGEWCPARAGRRRKLARRDEEEER